MTYIKPIVSPLRSLPKQVFVSGVSLFSALTILSGSSVWAQASDLAIDAVPAEATPAPAAPDEASAPAETSAPALALPEETPLAPIRGMPSEPTSSSAPSSNPSESYIDSTGYSVGATERSIDRVVTGTAQVPNLPATVQIGFYLNP
ncbi:hypothetical protein K9N68_28165 [Kovacikia minuta CCNUW1]|uniref:hypothetical protein n=1 Tax=Kovacikia minuta TaxID=2931930 RepID=UPI001CCE3968|nr:hypothetical protein [Kovacikia minuta]UBF25432.1 hypothetical protein K9N68_28165 [Kovacikia minuta CCNUW1]